MSEAQMSVEGRQQPEDEFDTIYSLRMDLQDIADLAGGYVNLKVRAMANLMLSTEDQDQRRAERPPTKTKTTKGMRASDR